MSKKKTTDEFIEEATKIHNNKYDYSKSIYTGAKTKVTIICPIHGEFGQTAGTHADGAGCKKCSDKANGNKRKLNTESFISKATVVHGNTYNYSKVNYVDNRTKVIIICSIHGAFEQIPNSHLDRCNGCRHCGYSNMKTAQTDTIETFITKVTKTHNNKYDYSKVKYINTKTKVTIICPIHGEFEQTPNGHNNGKGCQQCGYQLNTTALTQLGFITKCKEVHNNKYDYSKVKYSNAKNNITIICPIHGEFEQRPDHHINGNACPSCSFTGGVSKAETTLYEYVKSIAYEAIQSYKIEGTKKEFDIYIPSKKLAIEYDGAIWHSEKFAKNKFNIRDKTHLANSMNIDMIHVHEDLWLNHPNKIKALIKSRLGLNKLKIGARKTTIKEISIKDYRDFLNKYHTQSYRGANYKYGMYYKDELLAVFGFSDKELIRFAVKADVTVMGGLSKMMKHHGKSVFSYCDLDMFDGNGYLSAGFKLLSKTPPPYWYIKAGKPNRLPRQKFQRHKLPSLFTDTDCTGKTEKEICNENGYHKLYGVGNKKFEWIH